MYHTCTWLLMLSDDSTIECVRYSANTTIQKTTNTMRAALPPATSSVGLAAVRT